MIKIINSREMNHFLDNSDQKLRIVDVLDDAHYSKEHIQGAISLPLYRLEYEAAKILDKDDKIIVYCASIEWQVSSLAAKKLDSLGFKNVYDYEEGIKGYKEAGLPLAGCLHEAKNTVGCRD